MLNQEHKKIQLNELREISHNEPSWKQTGQLPTDDQKWSLIIVQQTRTYQSVRLCISLYLRKNVSGEQENRISLLANYYLSDW